VGAPYTIRVFLDRQIAVAYGTSANGKEVPVRKMIVSTGLGNRTPATGEGRYYSLGSRSLWRKFKLFGVTYHQYVTNFYGRNSSGKYIGNDFFFHSTAYRVNKSKSSLNVSSYNKLGSKASHGCIRLNVADAKYIYSMPGKTKVKVLKSSAGYNISAWGLPKFTIKASHPQGWDPYDPDSRNPFHKIITSTPTPTPVPTPEPIPEPTPEPTPMPTPAPTQTTGPEPTSDPTETAGPEPTSDPTETAGPEPTSDPTQTTEPAPTTSIPVP
jgi:hypothetical protein